MNHFIEIKLLPDPEFKTTVLMSSLYIKLHKALRDLASNSIGVSYPRYRVTLGDVLRIHGSSKDLETLHQKNWHGGMGGYCDISDVLPIPDNCQHRIISRVQTNMSQSKLNRLIKRGSISEDQVRQYKAKMFTKDLDNPYVELTSGSNGNKYRRYIEFGPLLDEAVAGPFNQFGLSKIATVPWF